MTKILQIDSSLFAGNGVSNTLTKVVVEKLEGKYQDYQVTTRDLAAQPVPHLDAGWITALGKSAEERTAEEAEKVSYSDQLIKEVAEADVIVIGLPMYNFGVPSVVKAWFDHIARAGVTFRYTSDGPEGLLKNKKVYLVTTRGGFHKDKSTDTQMPFMKVILDFIGLNDVEEIYAEGLSIGEEGHKNGIAQAHQTIEAIFA